MKNIKKSTLVPAPLELRIGVNPYLERSECFHSLIKNSEVVKVVYGGKAKCLFINTLTAFDIVLCHFFTCPKK